ncbi:hypothetical protein NFI96_006640, partial [Prochilodus magdalenae]
FSFIYSPDGTSALLDGRKDDAPLRTTPPLPRSPTEERPRLDDHQRRTDRRGDWLASGPALVLADGAMSGPLGTAGPDGPRATASAAGTFPSLGAGVGAGGGVPHTIRFQWRDPEGGALFTERVPFIREVLFGALGLKPEDLICAQRNNAQRFYDVTMASEAIYGRVLEQGSGLVDHPLGKNFVMVSMWRNNRRMVTTHVFNPFVSAEGQPAFCRGCLRHGHEVSGCKDLACKNCLGKGHLAKDCKNPRRCRGCGGEGHLAHSCPGHVRSYATVLAGAGGGPETAAEGEEETIGLRQQVEPSATSSPVEARSPAPGLHPRPRQEAPPVPRPREKPKNKKRRRDQEEKGRDRVKRAGPPEAAPEGASPHTPLSPKIEDLSLLVAFRSPPPTREYGGRVASPNEAAYLDRTEIIGGGQNLTILTMNVRGLRNPIKRAAVFHDLATTSSTICCLQEVHLRDQRDEALFSQQWKGGRAHWSVGGVHSTGVGILLGDHSFVKAPLRGRCKGVSVSPRWYSDHMMVKATASINAPSFGRGYWKLNVEVLEEREYQTLFRDHFAAWRGCKVDFASPAAWWECVKERTRALTIHYCSRRKAEKLKRVRDLEKQLQEQYAGFNNGGTLDLDRAQALRAELRVLHERSAADSLFHARLKWAEENETCSASFFQRVRQAREERCFTSLIDSEGGACSDPTRMMEVAHGFYSKLFSKRSTDTEMGESFLSRLETRLPNDARWAQSYAAALMGSGGAAGGGGEDRARTDLGAPSVTGGAFATKKKRAREQQERGKNGKRKVGPPAVVAPEGASVHSPLSPKVEESSVLVANHTPPSLMEHGGREASPNETSYLDGMEALEVSLVDFTVLTINVRGLSKATKRTAVFQDLASTSQTICCLPEVHLRDQWDEALFSPSFRAGPSECLKEKVPLVKDYIWRTSYESLVCSGDQHHHRPQVLRPTHSGVASSDAIGSRSAGALLRTFYNAVVASAFFYGVVCWGSSISNADRKRLSRIIKKSSSVLGCPFDPVEVVGDRRMRNMLKNLSHPIDHSVKALGSSFSARLLSDYAVALVQDYTGLFCILFSDLHSKWHALMPRCWQGQKEGLKKKQKGRRHLFHQEEPIEAGASTTSSPLEARSPHPWPRKEAHPWESGSNSGDNSGLQEKPPSPFSTHHPGQNCDDCGVSQVPEQDNHLFQRLLSGHRFSQMKSYQSHKPTLQSKLLNFTTPSNNPSSVASIEATDNEQTANASKAPEGAATGMDNLILYWQLLKIMLEYAVKTVCQQYMEVQPGECMVQDELGFWARAEVPPIPRPREKQKTKKRRRETFEAHREKFFSNAIFFELHRGANLVTGMEDAEKVSQASTAGTRSSASSVSIAARARAKAEAARARASFAEKEAQLKVEQAKMVMEQAKLDAELGRLALQREAAAAEAQAEALEAAEIHDGSTTSRKEVPGSPGTFVAIHTTNYVKEQIKRRSIPHTGAPIPSMPQPDGTPHIAQISAGENQTKLKVEDAFFDSYLPQNQTVLSTNEATCYDNGTGHYSRCQSQHLRVNHITQVQHTNHRHYR